MKISIDMYHALVDFLAEYDAALLGDFIEGANGEYDYILESLNIRGRGQVEIDESILKERETVYKKIAQEAVEELSDGEYMSHIDQRELKKFENILQLLEEIENYDNR